MTDNTSRSSSTFAIYLVLGLGFGTIVGVLTDHFGWGMGLGLFAGALLGAIFSGRSRRTSKPPANET